ncbi:UPF0676 protein C1494.01 [Seminavis robusta]|uniref:UPF0676 protein C1494.01 n=1 Tax=Seminavis robusta TaxID=568900 RepID=A0A9N8HYA5_9STRA|nr:UPF0676 protein C1494.01 [Seminavis robusta]|eukprot:Sro2810_g337590.1 UPF0676 protein C1494.01 (531) ;mRNA; f:1207-2964
MSSTSTFTTRSYDEDCMKAAIAQSQVAVEEGCMPFGAVLVDDAGNILAAAHNCSAASSKRGGKGDVTRHAEVELVRKMGALDNIDGKDKTKCTIYASTEPCVMCAGAIYWSGVSRVVYGCSSEELEQTLSGPGGFDIPVERLYQMGRPGMRKMNIVGPLLAKEAMDVHRASGVWCKPITTNNDNGKHTNQDIETERSLLQSGLGAAPATRDFQVPVISMSTQDDDDDETILANQLWDAARTVGFFTVVDHGIPLELIQQAFAVSADFFSNQTREEKEEQSPFAKELNSGYEYFTQVRPSTGTADQKESLQVTARQGVMEGRWPPEKFQDTATQLLEHAHKLANRILTLLEKDACPLNEAGTLAKSHTLWAPDGQCTLRFLHYPPMEPETAKQLTTPDEQGKIHWRAGPHTDWDNVTLLFQQPGQAGLECCSNPHDTTKGERRWTPIDPVEGGIAINIGDMLARWSDGRLYSNLHRVRMPTVEECTPPSSRYSIAYFAQSDKATVIRSKEGEDPITAGDYILSRIRSNFES